jgi:hypothetical protein
VGPLASFGDFYPFASGSQNIFEESVVESLLKTVRSCQPLYFRCGGLTCCDYLYFYVRLGETGAAELICNVIDAKHTNQDDGGGDSITTAEQEKLYKACCNVESAVRAAGLDLGAVRLLFLTNRKRLAERRNDSTDPMPAKQGANALFPEVELELLSKDTFEFGPFSDILWARRKPSRKRAVSAVEGVICEL